MSAVYLIRHGQAGNRDDYDRLSDLGHEQTRLLGAYLVEQQIPFTQLISGALRRQQETAANVVQELRRVGSCPELTTDPQWNEFDLDDVYRQIAPQIGAVDETFKQGYEELLRQMTSPEDAIHRKHSSLDIAVVLAWIANRFPYSGESFQAFAARIHGALEALKTCDGPVAVFTSATPTGLAVAAALELPIDRSMKLAGVAYNAGFSTLRVQPHGFTLFSFNNVPHLSDARLRTFR